MDDQYVEDWYYVNLGRNIHFHRAGLKSYSNFFGRWGCPLRVSPTFDGLIIFHMGNFWWLCHSSVFHSPKFSFRCHCINSGQGPWCFSSFNSLNMDNFLSVDIKAVTFPDELSKYLYQWQPTYTCRHYKTHINFLCMEWILFQVVMLQSYFSEQTSC